MNPNLHPLLAIVVLNVCLMIWRVSFRSGDILSLAQSEYSYVGQDHPYTYPMPTPLDTVAITLHNSVHFAVNSSNPESQDEWNLLATMPMGVGRTRLGPTRRVFVFTITHQMHCMRRMQLGLLNRSDPLGLPGHFSHCLNYLRQTIMCEAADSLERGDFIQQLNENDEQLGTTLVCQDWQQAYSFLDEKYMEWEEWKKEAGI
ncbi:hypothetical protein BDZ94DRAFT_1320961 [Collybia nuda]|uniref:Oxidase ustYa n=1 Tax=Collybia nuda TaxID=64659 RepID=A0A9P6CLB5_9AGAR|nr:hypothetical protein BDZ94DRAFT_1320961 [Collybia nuda]